MDGPIEISRIIGKELLQTVGISRQKKTNKKHHSVTERTHLFKNHHWWQIYMSCEELPEDQEILSSDDEDLLVLLPSKERKEF